MSLIKISDTLISSSGTHTVNLTGINSTYNTYVVKVSNVKVETDDKNISMRVTKGGAPQDDSTYDYVHENIGNVGTFTHTNIQNNSSFVIFDSSSNVQGETNNALIYLFNFPQASEFSWCTYETAHMNKDSNMRGYVGGGVHEVQSASDGVSFFTESSVDFSNGSEFVLYGLSK
tara:strand:- start:2135 stop:2656 length:522 start_codon:yes stop_codon:yes gene_type:complete